MSDQNKICENCEEILQGEFCHKCGQKNIDTNFSFFGLFGYLFKEFINWDNKVFRTFKYLLFRPGYLSKQYIAGKRASYMHPLRLYFFTSFFYFTLFFATSDSAPKNETGKNSSDTTAAAINKHSTDTIKKSKVKRVDSLLNKEFDGNSDFSFTQEDLNKLDNSFIQGFFNKLSSYPEGYISSKMLSYLPKFLFFILPIIALFLSLFYVRKKQFRFYNHFIYISHNHSFLFTLFFILILIPEFSYFHIIAWIIIIYTIIYLFISLKVVYAQTWLKTTFKFFLIGFSYLFLTLFSTLTLLFLIVLLN